IEPKEPAVSEEEEIERLRKIVEAKTTDDTKVATKTDDGPPEKERAPAAPTALTQFGVLLARRWKLFFRDRCQVLLQLPPLGVLVFAQSVWMTLFVNMIVGFQGERVAQALSLILLNAAITSICLGISSWMKSAEQSSLLSMYLVGFQLPLSGVLLALPKAIA